MLKLKQKVTKINLNILSIRLGLINRQIAFFRIIPESIIWINSGACQPSLMKALAKFSSTFIISKITIKFEVDANEEKLPF